MDVEFFREYCLSKKGVTEGFPFDQSTLVFKVMDKIFALTNIDLFESVNLKCDPKRAVELRETTDGIIAGFHMNKKHWNTVSLDGLVEDNLIIDLLNHSYEMVIKGMTKKSQTELQELE
jgi:predicted DNA-binding protein (MmcQ/YjbR family)